MAVKVIDGSVYTTVHDTDANGVAENDVRSGATKLYHVLVDNSGNAEIVFFKWFDNITPTEGTTEPDEIIPIAASKTRSFPIMPGVGLTIANLSFLVTSVNANDVAQTNPAATVLVTLQTDV